MIPPVSRDLRFLIPSITQRKRILEYIQNGNTLSQFKDLIKSIDIKPLATYIEASSILDGTNVFVKDTRTKEAIHYFTRNEPISGIFQFSILEQEEPVIVVN